MREEAQGADRGDESRDCGSATANGFGQGQWAAAGGEEGQAGKEEIIYSEMPPRILNTEGGIFSYIEKLFCISTRTSFIFTQGPYRQFLFINLSN